MTAATYKSSAGAISHLPVTQVSNLVQAMDRFKENGFWVAGASEHAEGLVWEANLKGKIVLVMGNEGEGLSRIVQDNCDFLVKLPQVGEVSSLNVAQASTACHVRMAAAEPGSVGLTADRNPSRRCGRFWRRAWRSKEGSRAKARFAFLSRQSHSPEAPSLTHYANL